MSNSTPRRFAVARFGRRLAGASKAIFSSRLMILISSPLGASVICASEVVSAPCRRRRETKLSAPEYLKARRALFQDIEDATVVSVMDEILAQAIELLERWPLRSPDALHVTSLCE